MRWEHPHRTRSLAGIAPYNLLVTIVLRTSHSIASLSHSEVHGLKEAELIRNCPEPWKCSLIEFEPKSSWALRSYIKQHEEQPEGWPRTVIWFKLYNSTIRSSRDQLKSAFNFSS